MAVGLSTAVHGIGSRCDVERNLQNRAHAHFNYLCAVCQNVGPVHVHPQMEHPYDIAGGKPSSAVPCLSASE